MQETHYDYIIAGSGCAGLSLAMHMIRHQRLQGKRILLVDEAEKGSNDRTWCFWEKETGFFEDIVFKQWDRIRFFSDSFSDTLAIAPYRYKMIRGADFYRHCLTELKSQPTVHFLRGKVERLFSGKTTGVVVEGKMITADFVFNSILFDKPLLGEKDIWLLQHFKGWLVRTEGHSFDENAATLMDFRIPQNEGTAFCYVLPFSSNRALVEYTLFTPSLLPPEAYDKALKDYIKNVLRIENYAVEETEFGVIPMTNHSFPRRQNNIINIGTAGGQTKGSSGYTFYFIQQHSRQLVESLARNSHPFIAPAPRRFHFYDSVLLQVLDQHLLTGNEIFSTMFRKNSPQDVLAFLNNQSSLPTELRIISTLPTFPFLKAAVRQMV